MRQSKKKKKPSNKLCKSLKKNIFIDRFFQSQKYQVLTATGGGKKKSRGSEKAPFRSESLPPHLPRRKTKGEGRQWIQPLPVLKHLLTGDLTEKGKTTTDKIRTEPDDLKRKK